MAQGNRAVITSAPSIPTIFHSEPTVIPSGARNPKSLLNKGGPVSAKSNLMDFGFFLRSAPSE